MTSHVTILDRNNVNICLRGFSHTIYRKRRDEGLTLPFLQLSTCTHHCSYKHVSHHIYLFHTEFQKILQGICNSFYCYQYEPYYPCWMICRQRNTFLHFGTESYTPGHCSQPKIHISAHCSLHCIRIFRIFGKIKVVVGGHMGILKKQDILIK